MKVICLEDINMSDSKAAKKLKEILIREKIMSEIKASGFDLIDFKDNNYVRPKTYEEIKNLCKKVLIPQSTVVYEQGMMCLSAARADSPSDKSEKIMIYCEK